MTKRKRKLTPEQKAAKRRRREEFVTIFFNGKQKRVKRPPTVDGMPLDEFIARNADPIWLHQNEMWEYMPHEAKGNEMEINFQCKKCRTEFDCEMGKIGINEQTVRPLFENPIVCPRCGERTMDEVLLTEIGQSQMTEATMDL